MSVYPTSTSNRMDPPEEPERTGVEWMELCAHCNACERLYQTFVDNREHANWREDMARIFKCNDCEEWTA